MLYMTECREGLHGINCSQQCVGRCRDGVTCNHVTGNCDGGCDAGWTGVLCNKGTFSTQTCNSTCFILLDKLIIAITS